MSFAPISSKDVNFFFIAHAEAKFILANKTEKTLLGDIDTDLSQTGQEQAETLAYQLMRLGIVFEKIYSSDLSRAKQTAAPIATQLNKKVITNAAFRETNKGDLQGKTRSEYTQLNSYKAYQALEKEPHEQFFYPMGLNGESKADAARKMTCSL